MAILAVNDATAVNHELRDLLKVSTKLAKELKLIYEQNDLLKKKLEGNELILGLFKERVKQLETDRKGLMDLLEFLKGKKHIADLIEKMCLKISIENAETEMEEQGWDLETLFV